MLKLLKALGFVSTPQPPPFTLGSHNYEDSQTPDHAWVKIERQQKFLGVERVDPNSPVPPNHTRFVCISDTHSQTDKLLVPEGHVLLHTGDFTDVGLPGDVERFSEFLHSLPHQHKVVIAGNHDITFDTQTYPKIWKRFYHQQQFDPLQVKSLLRNCIYLEDSETTINGIRIYGSPWQPEFGGWAFNLARGQEIDQYWQKIPANIDILMTHGPPLGRGDMCRGGDRAGCVDLLLHIQQRIKPLYHVFGHIHEDYGVSFDGQTTFINASTCNYQYQPINPPIVFDVQNKS